MKWLQPQPLPPDGDPFWWYQCIPSVAIVLKKSPDDIILGGCHSKQWSGVVFRTQNNVRSVDLVAMLGGVHLSDDAPLRMTDDPSQPLDSSWRFLPRKAALPFLYRVCDQKTNAAAVGYFTQHLDYLTCNEDLSLMDMTFPRPCFRPRFFETSPQLMTGLWNLNFNNGLQYAKTVTACPDDISCWHFISSLEGHLDNTLPPQ